MSFRSATSAERAFTPQHEVEVAEGTGCRLRVFVAQLPPGRVPTQYLKSSELALPSAERVDLRDERVDLRIEDRKSMDDDVGDRVVAGTIDAPGSPTRFDRMS